MPISQSRRNGENDSEGLEEICFSLLENTTARLCFLRFCWRLPEKKETLPKNSGSASFMRTSFSLCGKRHLYPEPLHGDLQRALNPAQIASFFWSLKGGCNARL